MHGFHNGWDYIATHLDNYVIGCVQEHRLYEWELHRLNTVCTNYKYIATSSMNANNVSKPGCSHGCLAIFYSSIFNAVPIGVSSNKRVQAVKLISQGRSFLVFNVYLPCLSNSLDYMDNIAQCCGFIDIILRNMNDYTTEVVIAGDFNYDAKSLFRK